MKNYDTAYRKIDKDSDHSDEETELFRLKPARKEIPSIEKSIEEGDTLQALAIRYNCTIEDLKRLNNIHKDNEIYAKTSIKVPYKPFSMALAGVHVSGKSSPNENTDPSVTNLISFDEFHIKLQENLEVIPKKESESDVNKIIFNTNLKHAPVQVITDDFCIEHSEEEINLLPQVEELPTADPVISKLNCSGADGDISWIALIVCIGVVIVAIPLIYVFYIAEHPEKYEHHHI
ncbi:lysM and putative peptidoglycan-binding domain-containing protein 3 isoform X2 [Aethina tumida]|nr:lysM and putative peptidoglycan-binding domain-containing protein 3 isoform X2 [Aethina tumida]